MNEGDAVKCLVTEMASLKMRPNLEKMKPKMEFDRPRNPNQVERFPAMTLVYWSSVHDFC